MIQFIKIPDPHATQLLGSKCRGERGWFVQHPSYHRRKANEANIEDYRCERDRRIVQLVICLLLPSYNLPIFVLAAHLGLYYMRMNHTEGSLKSILFLGSMGIYHLALLLYQCYFL